jgi:hypothetical protein
MAMAMNFCMGMMPTLIQPSQSHEKPSPNRQRHPHTEIPNRLRTQIKKSRGQKGPAGKGSPQTEPRSFGTLLATQSLGKNSPKEAGAKKKK